MTRPDAGLVVVTEFEVGGAGQQQALFDASRAAWDTLPWPETLLSIAWLASTDGQRALAYVQWRDDSEFEAYGRTHRPILAAHFKAAAPHGSRRRRRSSIAAIAAGRGPTPPIPAASSPCRSSSTGPDEARQRAWVDTVFEAIEAETTPPEPAASARTSTSASTAPASSTTPSGSTRHRIAPRSSAPGSAPSDRDRSGATCRRFPA